MFFSLKGKQCFIFFPCNLPIANLPLLYKSIAFQWCYVSRKQIFYFILVANLWKKCRYRKHKHLSSKEILSYRGTKISGARFSLTILFKTNIKLDTFIFLLCFYLLLAERRGILPDRRLWNIFIASSLAHL